MTAHVSQWLIVAFQLLTVVFLFNVHKEQRNMTKTTSDSLAKLTASVTALEAAAASSTGAPDDVAPALDAISARVDAVTASLAPKAA